MVDLSPGTSDRDADQFETYQAISPWAPASVLLGVAAAAALIHPLLWFVPLLGIVVSCLSLRQLAPLTGRIGRKGVLLGLALSLFFGAIAPARTVTRSWLLTRESRRISVEWVELIRDGDLEQAHQWTLEATRRHQSNFPVKEYYEENPDAWKDFQEFFQSDEMRNIVEFIRSGKVRYSAQVSVQSDRNSIHVVDQFVVDDTDGKREVRLSTYLKRTVDRQTGKAYWQIEGIRRDRSL